MDNDRARRQRTVTAMDPAEAGDGTIYGALQPKTNAK